MKQMIRLGEATSRAWPPLSGRSGSRSPHRLARLRRGRLGARSRPSRCRRGADLASLLGHLRLGAPALQLRVALDPLLLGELLPGDGRLAASQAGEQSLKHEADDTPRGEARLPWWPRPSRGIRSSSSHRLARLRRAGVARLNGFVVFVNRALPGDVVRAGHESEAEPCRGGCGRGGRGRRSARGGAVRALPACGGCRFQDLAYEAQLEAKAQQVADALRRIGGFSEVELEPPEAARSVFHYRNKLEYSFTRLASVGLGFHRGRWDEVLDADRCWLTTDLGNGIRGGEGLGARRGLPRLRPGAAAGLPAPSRRPRGPQHRPGARRPRHRASATSPAPTGRRRCARFPRCAPSTGR